MSDPAEPERFGPYVLGQRLGGQASRTHRALDTRDRSEVVLKRARGVRGDEDARLDDEIDALRRLRHRGLPQLREAGEHAGQRFVALRYVPGASVGELFDALGRVGDRLSEGAIAALGLDGAEALAAAHGAGLLHRDLSPDNLLVDYDGRAAVTDLGLASFRGRRALTAHGQLAGTPGFLAPERRSGGAATTASDVYALGAVLWLLATERPMPENDEARLASAALNRCSSPLQQLLLDATAPLAARIATADALASRLAALDGIEAGRAELAARVGALFASARPEVSSRPRRPRRLLLGSALVATLGIAWAVQMASPPKPKPKPKPTPTPTPAPTPTPTPTPTASPSPTPYPSPTPSRAPSPPRVPAEAFRAFALVRAGRIDEAMAIADRSPRDLAALLKAEIAVQHGEPARAVEHAGEAVRDGSPAVADRARRIRARALLQLGRHPEAARDFEALLRQHPGDDELRASLRIARGR